jgi:Putative lumazine-binding
MTTTLPQAWTAGPTVEAGPGDRAAIRAAMVDYCRGWFEADPAAMRRALDPRLAKFSVGADPARSAEADVITFDEMIDATTRGNGVARAGDGSIDISILGVSGSIACAELRVESYVEFVLLLRVADGWRIVSTAWRWGDGAGPRAPG